MTARQWATKKDYLLRRLFFYTSITLLHLRVSLWCQAKAIHVCFSKAILRENWMKRVIVHRRPVAVNTHWKTRKLSSVLLILFFFFSKTLVFHLYHNLYTVKTESSHHSMSLLMIRASCLQKNSYTYYTITTHSRHDRIYERRSKQTHTQWINAVFYVLHKDREIYVTWKNWPSMCFV